MKQRRFSTRGGRRCGTVATRQAASAQQPPRFTSSVEVTSVDVTVVDDRGRPITGLGARGFHGAHRRQPAACRHRAVGLAHHRTKRRCDRRARRLQLERERDGRTPDRDRGRSAEHPLWRRTQAISRAAGAFLDRLSPSDRIAVTGFGPGAPVTPFSGDRERAKRALMRMTGQRQSRRMDSGSVSVAEAQAIDRGDRTALQAVQDRECNPANFPRNAAALDQCRAEVEAQAQQIAQEERANQTQTLSGLRDLLTGLRTIDAPKTLILITEGFVVNDPAYVIEVGSLAAAARTGLYALKLEREMFDASESRMHTECDGRSHGVDGRIGYARRRRAWRRVHRSPAAALRCSSASRLNYPATT